MEGLMARSRHIFIIFILSWVYFSGTAVYSEDQPAAVNSADSEKPEDKFRWDFGIVKAGLLLQHDFILKNESAKELNIREVNTSCGCTVSRVKNKALKPQESTVIEVKFNSKGYTGKVKQFVFLTTDNLDNPVLRYTIEAEVMKQPSKF
jgi:hypothetical protein